MGAVHRAVLGTRGLPGFSALYRNCYRLATPVCARGLQASPGIRSIYLHRGLSRGHCDPGISDIDFVIVGRAGLGDDDPHEWLPALAARYHALKRFFPMLGDLWIGDPEELQNYLRWGGARAWEDRPYWRLIRGDGAVLPESQESSDKRRWLDPWVWAFVSYMELSRRVWTAPSQPPAKEQAELRKLYLDARRYAEFIDSSQAQSPRPRSSVGESARDELRLRPRELWLDSALRLARASSVTLDRTRSGRRACAEFPRLEGNTADMSGKFGSSVRLVVLDAPYHGYAVLAEGAQLSDYALAAEALRKEQAGVPLVLDGASWSLALQSAYLGAPLGWLGSGGKSAEAASAVFPGWGPVALGELSDVPLLRDELRWEIAAESASWMALWWRFLWIGRDWSNRFVLFHLYSRVLGLRLLLAGEPDSPFSDWQMLLARASASFPEEARGFARVRDLLMQTPAEALDSTERNSLAQTHLSAVADQMRALQTALTRGPAKPQKS